VGERWELKDMAGQTVGGWLVVRRLPSATGNATWLCRHTCETPQERSIQGIQLRSKAPKYCDGCRPANVAKWGSRYRDGVRR
jgi:hypothetical protein